MEMSINPVLIFIVLQLRTKQPYPNLSTLEVSSIFENKYINNDWQKYLVSLICYCYICMTRKKKCKRYCSIALQYFLHWRTYIYIYKVNDIDPKIDIAKSS